jgi:NAD(P)-dependent dehydrogenase (short-subunit alcohol dehydrogenase family)
MANLLRSLGPDLRVIIIGASGGIGRGFLDQFERSLQVSQVFALSRSADAGTQGKVTSLAFDLTNEDNIAASAELLRHSGKFDLILVATGLLQDDGITPEKNMRAITRESLLKSFEINTIGPALCAKYFLPLLHRDRKTVFAALSARVGSISDNRLGGWYAYRASKAALNMVIKTLSLEFTRRYPHAVICGLHPGTVDTSLSAPFQGNVPDGKLFTPEFSAEKMIRVIDDLSSEHSGYLFAWDGKKIEF